MGKTTSVRTTRKNTGTRYAARAVATTPPTSSGSAATSARDGSTANASKSLPPERSTLSSTSAPLAATREAESLERLFFVSFLYFSKEQCRCLHYFCRSTPLCAAGFLSYFHSSDN